jgi:hypothetical protein
LAASLPNQEKLLAFPENVQRISLALKSYFSTGKTTVRRQITVSGGATPERISTGARR